MEPASTSAVSDDASAVAWWVLVGVGSGAIAGFLIGGVGGRLAMLLLRLTSPDLVIGMTSDDGFEIGVLSTSTLGLLAGMTLLGAVNGLLYAALRERDTSSAAAAALDAVGGCGWWSEFRPRGRDRLHGARAGRSCGGTLRRLAGAGEPRSSSCSSSAGSTVEPTR